jgi:hypothetical protein
MSKTARAFHARLVEVIRESGRGELVALLDTAYSIADENLFLAFMDMLESAARSAGAVEQLWAAEKAREGAMMIERATLDSLLARGRGSQ